MDQSVPHAIPISELLTGRRDTLDRLMPEVYEELMGIARRQFAGREGGGTLSPTGLVREACLKLADQSRIAWRDWAKARMLPRRALSL